MNSKITIQLVKFITAIWLITLQVSCNGYRNSGDTFDELHIHDVQGCGHFSPLNGKQINNLSGVVTYKDSSGFFMQDQAPDSLDCTSEGIYVFTEKYTSLLPGDFIIVTGTVLEFFPGENEDNNLSKTEIIEPIFSIISRGTALPEPVVLGENSREIPDLIIDNDRMEMFDPGEDGLDYFESLESMLVKIEEGVVVGPRNSYNEVVIIQPSQMNINLISQTGALLNTPADLNPERMIINMNSANTEQINVGAYLLEPITGIIEYSYGNYKIRAFGKIKFHTDKESEEIYLENDGLSIASYNVENLSVLDEISRFNKIAGQITEDLRSPDIVVIHEVMDDSGISDDGITSAQNAIETLVSKISDNGSAVYDYVQIDPLNNADGGIPGGNIRSIILYRVDTGITLVNSGIPALMQTNPALIGNDGWMFEGSRKPLVCLFKNSNTNFLIIAVHLTSKSTNSPLFGKIQPINQPSAAIRHMQATEISKWMTEFQKDSPQIPVILAGDINDDPWSKTIDSLTGDQMIDLGARMQENEKFSYILDGNAIQLDYIFVSGLLEEHDFLFNILHLNSIYDDHMKVSDHDPVIGFFENW